MCSGSHLPATRALEVPFGRLWLPQLLPWCHMRTVAEILERRAAVMRVLVMCEVKQRWFVLLITTFAHRCTERICIVRQHATDMSNKWFVRNEHELDIHARTLALRLELSVEVDAVVVRKDVRETASRMV